MSDLPADELLRIALAHIDVRLREYDSDKSIVRVNRKFVEILTKYGPILRTLSKSADFWRSRVTVLEEENTALREKINNLTAFNDDLRDAVDDLKKQTNEYVTVISRVTHNSRKWRTRAQEWRARAEKAESLNEQSNLRQHGRTAFIKYGKTWRNIVGENVLREKIKNIDTRLRAWSDTPCESADELRAMAVLVESIKSAARLVARAEEE